MFTSKIDILLPSYLKSASESVHQLYGASEALSYLEYIEELAHPATYLLEYIMSRAASDIGDVSGVMGGRPQPPSPPTSVHASPSPAPPSPLGPLDLLNKPDIIKSVTGVPHQEGCFLHRTSIHGHQGHLQQLQGYYTEYIRPHPQ